MQPRKTACPRWQGDRLRSLMAKRGMSTTQLGAMMDVTESAVRAWRGGSTPGAARVARLAEVFNVPMDYFFVVQA